MRHLTTVSKMPQAATVSGTTSLEIKLNGIMLILDRLALAQRQAAWKAPFPIGGIDSTTTSSTSSNSTLSTS